MTQATRAAVVLLLALLAFDASWCCYGARSVAPNDGTVIAADAFNDGAAGVDCHTCICSGLAIIEAVPARIPLLRSSAFFAPVIVRSVNVPAPVDVPPDEPA
jgi:hypothetical protein